MFSESTKAAANTTKDMAANDLKDSASKAKREARSVSDDVVSDLSAYANKAGRTMRSFINTAGDEISHVSEKLTTEIRTNPVRSSLIALGAGLVLGALLRR